MSLLSWILDLLFPPKCPFCRKLLKDGAETMCLSCSESLPKVRDGETFKVDFMTKAVAPLYYEKQVRESFLRYKFNRVSAYATAYAPLMAESIQKELDGTFDCITWVPLGKKRLRKRGFDQSALLAENVAALLNVPLVCTMKKVRETKVQSTLTTPEERRGNISGAYSLVNAEAIQGKRVLLVDDILTTGATMAECARVLLLGGAESVCGAAFARKRGDIK